MTRHALPAALLLLLSGCGLENLFSNVAHEAYERPASRIVGSVTGIPQVTSIDPEKLNVVDADGNVLALPVNRDDLDALGPFQRTAEGTSYDVRLPSSRYAMHRLEARIGNFGARVIIPYVGEESTVTVDLSPRAVTETLIVEAHMSAIGESFRVLSPEAFAGASANIRAAFETAGPTQELLQMVERIYAKGDPTISTSAAYFFTVPVILEDPPDSGNYSVSESPVSRTFLGLTQFDYTGDGVVDTTTDAFDAKLLEVALAYRPEGCVDPDRLRVMFTVDFNASALNGNCGVVNRFLWAKDRPGKSMFFVGWVHRESEVQSPAINTLVGASTPNQIQMYDNGTNGDEVAGDNIHTVYFDLPYDPGAKLRLGYKYTWGTPGAIWTGSEEWPGNSRIIEIADLNADGFVYRRDVFSDEATNKDKMNLFNGPGATGSVSWDTALHGCGPEARENRFVAGSACACGEFHTPESVGPITIAEPPGGCP